MQTVQAALVAAIAAVALAVSPLPASAGEYSKLALTISIDGAIGPATAGYVKDALTTASERRAEVVVLRLNTPGGLSTSMREIIADVLASPDSRRRLRRSFRSPCGQRRDLYPLRNAYSGNGAGHQSRCRDAGADWQSGAGSAERYPRQERRRQERQRPPAGTKGHHDGEGNERRRRLHPQSC